MPYTDIKTDLILNEISEEQLHSQQSLPPNQYWLTEDDGLDNSDVISGIINDISRISQKTFSNYPMPSDTYETLTPTTSGTVFIAPTNGWFCATGTSTSTYHCQISLTNANGFTSRSQISGYKDTGCRCFLPAKRGDSITFTNQNMTSMVVRFYYAEGEI